MRRADRRARSASDVRPVVIGQTLLVVAQHFEDAAVGHAVGVALADHAAQFRAQRVEPGKAGLDLFQLPLRHRIDLRARAFGTVREIQQLPYRFKREAKFAGVADERQRSSSTSL